MTDSVFYAFLSRMKYIGRWSLRRITRTEKVLEHSATVAMCAHALAVLRVRNGGNVDPDRIGMMALFHETGEVLTGDLPTPVKYFNGQLHGEYEKVERLAVDKIAATLPEPLKGALYPLLQADKTSEEYAFVKAADKLSAYLKCLEELRSGNSEFVQAEKTSAKRSCKSRCAPSGTFSSILSPRSRSRSTSWRRWITVEPRYIYRMRI